MFLRIRSFHLQKGGNAEAEYEDACWPEQSGCWHGRSFRCAMADGATETSFSGLWARLLVGAWGRRELGERSIATHLPALQRAWMDSVGSRPLPWYAEEKVRSGAFSSLLGVTVAEHTDGSPGGRWRALAVGDTCLFHISQDRLRRAFPVHQSVQFDNRPHLLSSNAAANGEIDSCVRLARGRWWPGDALICMTDALAQWFLQATERCDIPWNAVNVMADSCSQPDFTEWIGGLRDKRLLRNDDVTLLVITLLEERAVDALADTAGL